jgi:GxxExxY protein
MERLLHKELTGAIIGAYYEVYNNTGRTYPEYIYEQAMMYELRQRDIPSTRQEEYRVFYKERPVGVQQLDIFVAKEVVVENKVVEHITPLHKAQAISYLKTVGKAVGLIFNFGGREPEFERVYFERREVEHGLAKLADKDGDWVYPELAYEIVGGLYEVRRMLGPGFIHRIYANAFYYEMELRGLEVKPFRSMQIRYKKAVIGEIKFGHLLVEGRVMVFPVVIRDIEDIHIESLKDWMRMQKIELGVLANFHAISLKPLFLRA